MASEYIVGLDFGYNVEVGVVHGFVHDDVENESADEEDGGEDEDEEAVAEDFELVIFRDHWRYVYLRLIRFSTFLNINCALLIFAMDRLYIFG